jgi:putative ABC transport system permease protein
VTPGYLPALRIPLIAGRGFIDADRESGEPVALLNEAAARRWFPGESAVGKRVRLTGESDWRRIVGIVGDTRSTFYNTLGWQVNRRIFVPYRQDPRGGTSPVAHRHVFYARGPVALSGQAARDLVWSVDRNLPVSTVQPLDARVAGALRQPRLRSALIGLFAIAALLLAVIGLYGIVSQSVSQRTRELGIRLALGAQRRDVAAMVLGQGCRLTAVGALLGIAGALAVTRLLSALLYGIAPTDPVTYASVCALLTAVALAGSYIPARRATRVDPAIVLRNE